MGYDGARNRGNWSFVGRDRSGGWKHTDRLLEGNGVGDRSKQIVCWKGTDRLYGSVEEKSIDFRKILYRLFRKTL